MSGKVQSWDSYENNSNEKNSIKNKTGDISDLDYSLKVNSTNNDFEAGNVDDTIRIIQ